MSAPTTNTPKPKPSAFTVKKVAGVTLLIFSVASYFFYIRPYNEYRRMRRWEREAKEFIELHKDKLEEQNRLRHGPVPPRD